MPDSLPSISRADWCSGCPAEKKLMWLVSTRSRRMPPIDTRRPAPRRASDEPRPPRRDRARPACIGPISQRSCGGAAVSAAARTPAASAPGPATSRSRPSRRRRRRCRRSARRGRGWSRATACRAPSCRWRRAAARTGTATVVDERLLAAAGRARALGVVLDDVHVVGDGQHHDQRQQHAAQHVEGEAHERVEPQRPEHADEHATSVSSVIRHERNSMKSAASVISRIGGVNVYGVGDGDAVVGLADLEAAVVVGARCPAAGGDRRPRGSRSMRLAAGVVDAILVEVDDDRDHRASAGDEVAAQERIGERRSRTTLGARRCGPARGDQRPHLDAGVVAARRSSSDRCWRWPGCRRATT